MSQQVPGREAIGDFVIQANPGCRQQGGKLIRRGRIA